MILGLRLASRQNDLMDYPPDNQLTCGESARYSLLATIGGFRHCLPSGAHYFPCAYTRYQSELTTKKEDS